MTVQIRSEGPPMVAEGFLPLHKLATGVAIGAWFTGFVLGWFWVFVRNFVLAAQIVMGRWQAVTAPSCESVRTRPPGVASPRPCHQASEMSKGRRDADAWDRSARRPDQRP